MGDSDEMPQAQGVSNVSGLCRVLTELIDYFYSLYRPRHAENPSPSSYIMLIHREFLKKICDESELQGLTYHGGPFLEKCPRPGCSWRGVLPFVSYPEETDYSTKVICDHCNHECDVDTLLQVNTRLSMNLILCTTMACSPECITL